MNIICVIICFLPQYSYYIKCQKYVKKAKLNFKLKLKLLR